MKISFIFVQACCGDVVLKQVSASESLLGTFSEGEDGNLVQLFMFALEVEPGEDNLHKCKDVAFSRATG